MKMIDKFKVFAEPISYKPKFHDSISLLGDCFYKSKLLLGM